MTMLDLNSIDRVANAYKALPYHITVVNHVHFDRDLDKDVSWFEGDVTEFHTPGSSFEADNWGSVPGAIDVALQTSIVQRLLDGKFIPLPQDTEAGDEQFENLLDVYEKLPYHVVITGKYGHWEMTIREWPDFSEAATDLTEFQDGYCDLIRAYVALRMAYAEGIPLPTTD